MNSPSIKVKLWLVLLVTLGALAGIKAVDLYFGKQVERAFDARQALASLQTDLGMLRQHEKDFLARKDPADVAAFNSAFARYQRDYQALVAAMNALGQDTATLADADRQFQLYRLSFDAVVEKQQVIGLDHTQGLYGALRNAAHQVEQVVADYPLLMASLLMLRRHEKDFMLRRLDTYSSRFMTGLSTFRGHLFLSDIDTVTMAGSQKALRNYSAAFQTLVQTEREIGLERTEGLHGNMQQQITVAEQTFDAVREGLDQRISAYIDSAGRASSAVIIGMMAVIGLALLWLMRDLGRSLARAGHSARALAAGDWHTAISTRRSDELGELMHTLETMRQALLEKTAALEADSRLKHDQAQLASVLQGTRDTSDLAESVIRFVTPLLGCQLGALYVTHEDRLVFQAGYGVERRENLPAEIEFGEGLAGQCASSQQALRVDSVPPDYLRISSGTGNSVPGTVVVAPLMWEDRLYGVIELGALGNLDDYANTFLAAASESIAIAINSARMDAELNNLLETAMQQTDALQEERDRAENANELLQLQAEKLQSSEEELRVQQEELQAQEEELRVANEELEAQTRLMQRRTGELEREVRELRGKLHAGQSA